MRFLYQEIDFSQNNQDVYNTNKYHKICIHYVLTYLGIPRWFHDETTMKKWERYWICSFYGKACFTSSKTLWPYGPYDIMDHMVCWYCPHPDYFDNHRHDSFGTIKKSISNMKLLFRFQRRCLQSDVNLSTWQIGDQHLKLVTNTNCIQHPSSKPIKPFFDPAI